MMSVFLNIEVSRNLSIHSILQMQFDRIQPDGCFDACKNACS
jgi:hypothetical protein